MIQADFNSILVTENNGNQNPDQSYTNKYHKCTFGCKLVCADDQLIQQAF